MSSQRYHRVANGESAQTDMNHSDTAIPNSPPASYRSRASSRRASRDDTAQTEEERRLDNAFDPPSEDDDEEDEDDDDDDDDTRDRRRLIPSSLPAPVTATQNTPALSSAAERPGAPQRNITQLPTFTPTAPSGRSVGNSAANDGVFANLSAKPRAGEDLEEKPPTYEQAAADATPPYWETTVLSPYAHSGNPDDVFVDGLLVGSLFSFIWNALISMSFQLIGFLLTYLLHTTHAAKHGSRAGLGITLIQYGFQMRYSSFMDRGDGSGPGSPSASSAGGPTVSVGGVPEDPNAHAFDPSQVTGIPEPGAAPSPGSTTGLSPSDWLAYGLMIVGWFILIRSVTSFMRARRQEALVRSSPDRGLGVAVVAENEAPETSV